LASASRPAAQTVPAGIRKPSGITATDPGYEAWGRRVAGGERETGHNERDEIRSVR